MPAGHRHQCSLHLWRTYTRKEVAIKREQLPCLCRYIVRAAMTSYHTNNSSRHFWWYSRGCCASRDQEDCSWYIPQWRRAWNQWSPPELEGTVGRGWREPWAQTAGLVEGQLLDGLCIELHFLSNLDKLNQLSSRTDLWRRKSAWSVVDPREKQERRWLRNPGKIF